MSTDVCAPSSGQAYMHAVHMYSDPQAQGIDGKAGGAVKSSINGGKSSRRSDT